ncbi:hypothetical protein BDZ91DRAFT_764994 [Kalaharituber pfeilii]|nr:hypothetical protein BDZ91DRAFT_764994 [Kalaharituber pfeilii]
MTPEELTDIVKKSIEMAMQGITERISALEGRTPESCTPQSPAQQRQAILEAKKIAIEKEMQAIRDNTWLGSTEGTDSAQLQRLGGPGTMVTTNYSQSQKPRFEPNSLPKYRHYTTSLEQWINEITGEVALYGESMVCPAIYKHCFSDGDMVRDWYVMLSSELKQAMTTGTGCWQFFSAIMRQTWAESIGSAQTKAIARTKRHNETFLQYYYQKLGLLKAAFPDCADQSHISNIKEKLNDPIALFYIRECNNLGRLAQEMGEYDEVQQKLASQKTWTRMTTQGTSTPSTMQRPIDGNPQVSPMPPTYSNPQASTPKEEQLRYGSGGKQCKMRRREEEIPGRIGRIAAECRVMEAGQEGELYQEELEVQKVGAGKVLQLQPKLKKDGKNYLNCKPLMTLAHLGSYQIRRRRIVQDTASNTSVMDEALFRKLYPETHLHTEYRMPISGVGKKMTLGFAVITVWLSGKCGDEEAAVAMDLEDGSMRRTSNMIYIAWKGSKEGKKYGSRQGEEICGAPPVPSGLLNARKKFVMYRNSSDQPRRIERNDILGQATPLNAGAYCVDTGEELDWDNVVRPGIRVRRFGKEPPIGIKGNIEEKDITNEEELLQFLATKVNTTTSSNAGACYIGEGIPRSISGEEVIRIASMAQNRKEGEQWPLKLMRRNCQFHYCQGRPLEP